MNRFDKEEQAKRNAEHKQAIEYSEMIGKRIGAVPRAEHTVNIGLVDLERTLETYVKAENLVLEPDFQRGHVWSEAQQIAYCESFIRQALNDSGRTITFNSAQNAEYAFGHTDMDSMVCVDGLQRLTAMRRLMKKEFKVFKKELDGGVYWDFFNDTRYNLLSVGSGFLFQFLNIPYKKDVLAYYLAFNGAGTPHTENEIQRVWEMHEQL